MKLSTKSGTQKNGLKNGLKFSHFLFTLFSKKTNKKSMNSKSKVALVQNQTRFNRTVLLGLPLSKFSKLIKLIKNDKKC